MEVVIDLKEKKKRSKRGSSNYFFSSLHIVILNGQGAIKHSEKRRDIQIHLHTPLPRETYLQRLRYAKLYVPFLLSSIKKKEAWLIT